MDLHSADAAQITPATPDMAPVACTLIYSTMGKMADYLFGDGDAQRACELLMRLFSRSSNRFSYRFADAALVSGNVAGIIVAYSGTQMRALEMRMAWQLIQQAGLVQFIRFAGRALPLLRVKEAEDNEYFISHVAVLPGLRGKGIGSSLLVHAEHAARAGGYRKLSLTVDVENERAQALYLRTGFKPQGQVEIPALRRRFGYCGFVRMVKDLR